MFKTIDAVWTERVNLIKFRCGYCSTDVWHEAWKRTITCSYCRRREDIFEVRARELEEKKA